MAEWIERGELVSSTDELETETTTVTFLTDDGDYSVEWSHPPSDTKIGDPDQIRIPVKYDHMPEELESFSQGQAESWELVVTSGGETVSGHVVDATPYDSSTVMFTMVLD